MIYATIHQSVSSNPRIDNVHDNEKSGIAYCLAMQERLIKENNFPKNFYFLVETDIELDIGKEFDLELDQYSVFDMIGENWL